MHYYRDQNGKAGGSGAHLTQKCTKPVLHVEQLSQKTDWKLADLFYNQSCKEDFHVTKDGGQKAFKTGLAPLRGSCKEGKVHMGRTPSWGAPLACCKVC